MGPDGRLVRLGASSIEDSRLLLDVDGAVFAGGGHSLKRGDDLYSEAAASDMLNPIFRRWGDVGVKVLTHGNGSQWALQEAICKEKLRNGQIEEMPPPHMITKETQDLGGGVFKRALPEFTDQNAEIHNTKVVVDPNDMEPRKGTGNWVSGRESFDQAGVACLEHPERPGFFREAVPSPRVLDIIALDNIRYEIQAGVLVVACGGGGIPVIVKNDEIDLDVSGWDLEGGTEIHQRNYKYVPGRVIVDKDDATRELADRLGLQLMVAVTGADGCYEYFSDPNRKRLVPSMTPDGAYQFAADHIPSTGDMAPKILSVADFVRGGAGRIGLITSAESLMRGDVNQMTQIREGLRAV